MLKWISQLADRVCVVIGALIFIQAPIFMQHYLQQLVGRVDELTQQVDVMRQVAMESNKTLEQFIQKFVDSADVDFAQQGLIMKNLIDRWRFLNDGLLSMDHASVWFKPWAFLQYFDYQIAQSTFSHYQFGIALTYEGLIYGLIGICVGYGSYSLMRKVILAISQKINQTKNPPVPFS